jgi:antitoxin VapB
MLTLTTRVFNNGNSQAVRIPAEFRLDTDQVSITRNDEGDLVIRSLSVDRGASLLAALHDIGDIDPTFADALEADRIVQLPMREREPL